MYGTAPNVLHGYATWSVNLREEQRSSENRVPMGVFWPESGEQETRKLQDMLHNLCFWRNNSRFLWCVSGYLPDYMASHCHQNIRLHMSNGLFIMWDMQQFWAHLLHELLHNLLRQDHSLEPLTTDINQDINLTQHKNNFPVLLLVCARTDTTYDTVLWNVTPCSLVQLI
jgi:hypothetical protein